MAIMRSKKKTYDFKKVKMDFIISRGLYPDFMRYCTTHNLMKFKQNKRAYLYLRAHPSYWAFVKAMKAIHLSNVDRFYDVVRTFWSD